MGHAYYRQARFAGNRFQKQGGAIQSHEAAYLAAKEMQRPEEPRKHKLPKARPFWEKDEILYQCWKCLSVRHVESQGLNHLRCGVCGGPVEVLTVNGVAQ